MYFEFTEEEVKEIKALAYTVTTDDIKKKARELIDTQPTAFTSVLGFTRVAQAFSKEESLGDIPLLVSFTMYKPFIVSIMLIRSEGIRVLDIDLLNREGVSLKKEDNIVVGIINSVMKTLTEESDYVE